MGSYELFARPAILHLPPFISTATTCGPTGDLFRCWLIELSRATTRASESENFTLAKALKFDSAHDVDVFFSSQPKPSNPAPSPDAASAPTGFGGLAPDERVHAMLSLIEYDGADMWMMRALGLLELLVELERSEFSQLMSAGDGEASFLSKLRKGLDLNLLAQAKKSMPSSADHRASRILGQYLESIPSYDERSARQSVTAHEQHGYLVGIVTKVLDRAERIEERSGLLLAPAAAMEIFAKRGREALTLDIFDGHWLGEARFGRVVARLAQRRDAEGLRQESLDVWGFLQAAIATPIASERSAAMSCLMDIANMPDKHCVQACADMLSRMERAARVSISEQSSEPARA